jgi:hypothetical protein
MQLLSDVLSTCFRLQSGRAVSAQDSFPDPSRAEASQLDLLSASFFPLRLIGITRRTASDSVSVSQLSLARIATLGVPRLGGRHASASVKDSHHLDTLVTQKTQKVRMFLLAHPRVHLHFTPTYSFWLNQVECRVRSTNASRPLLVPRNGRMLILHRFLSTAAPRRGPSSTSSNSPHQSFSCSATVSWMWLDRRWNPTVTPHSQRKSLQRDGSSNPPLVCAAQVRQL